MTASKQGVITLDAQNITYGFDETCTQTTNFTGTSTYAKYPSRFCLEKESAGGEACSGNFFFSKYSDSYVEGCEDSHEDRIFYGWEDNSYSWVNVNVYCCYR